MFCASPLFREAWQLLQNMRAVHSYVGIFTNWHHQSLTCAFAEAVKDHVV